MRSIWHHGAWNRNYGDWVLRDSIQHHLGAAMGRPVRITPIDSQTAVYDADLIEQLNAQAELLVIGGGGLIFNRPEDRSASGWQFNIRRKDIDHIRVPIVVYGIGYNRFPFDTMPFPSILDAHLRTLQKKSVLFSVRNNGTRQELIRRGSTPDTWMSFLTLACSRRPGP